MAYGIFGYVGNRLRSLPAFWFVTIVLAVALIRNGLSPLSWEHGSLSQAADFFPRPANAMSSVPLATLIYWALPESLLLNPVSGLIPMVISASVVAAVLSRRAYIDFGDWRAPLLLFSLTPVATLLLGHGEARDWIVVLGASLFLLAQNTLLRYGALIVGSLGTTEQMIVGMAALYVASLSPVLHDYRRIARTGLLISAIIWGLIQSWMVLGRISSNRLLEAIPTAPSTVSNFLANPYIFGYAALAASWLLVIFILYLARGQGRTWPIIAALIVLLAASSFTTDGLRDFACVATPLLLAMIMTFQRKVVQEAEGEQTYFLGLIATIGFLSPAISWSTLNGTATLLGQGLLAPLAAVVKSLLDDLANFVLEYGPRLIPGSNFRLPE